VTYPSATGRYQKWAKNARANGISLKVNPRGVKRRLEALQALGYSYAELGAIAGKDRTTVAKWMTKTWFERATAKTVYDLYDYLHMTPSTGVAAKRTRTLAKKRGFAPPLAWDDIDTDRWPAPGHTREGYCRTNRHRITAADTNGCRACRSEREKEARAA
jgi:hypothetical protein